MAVPGTPLAGYFQYSLKGNLGGNRYLAPEIQWPEDYGTDEVIVTKESDVFGMAMVIYEARSYKSSRLDRIKSHVNSLGLGGR